MFFSIELLSLGTCFCPAYAFGHCLPVWPDPATGDSCTGSRAGNCKDTACHVLRLLPVRIALAIDPVQVRPFGSIRWFDIYFLPGCRCIKSVRLLILLSVQRAILQRS